MVSTFEKISKNAHWVLLVLIILSYVILIVNASTDDEIIKKISKIILGVTTFWAGLILVLTLRQGEQDKIIERIRKAYLRLLGSRLFLYPMNLILIVIFGCFMYILIFYRNVEFISDTSVELFCSDAPGEKTVIGTLEAKKVVSFRIKSGTRNFYFKKVGSKNINSLFPIEIPPFWSDAELERIPLNPEPEHENLP